MLSEQGVGSRLSEQGVINQQLGNLLSHHTGSQIAHSPASLIQPAAATPSPLPQHQLMHQQSMPTPQLRAESASSAQGTPSPSRRCSLRLKGSGGKRGIQRDGVDAKKIVVVPHALSRALCDDLLDKVDELYPKFDLLGGIATQPDGMRRLFRLGPNGTLYHRCKYEGAQLLSNLGMPDLPVYKPTLVIGKPGAKHGLMHRDFKRFGLSITFSLTHKSMLWGDNAIRIKQPLRSGTVFDGNHCHGSDEIEVDSPMTALLHLYAGHGITAEELRDTYQCLLVMAVTSGELEDYALRHGGQLTHTDGWKGIITDERRGKCDLKSPDGLRFCSLTAVLEHMGLVSSMPLAERRVSARLAQPSISLPVASVAEDIFSLAPLNEDTISPLNEDTIYSRVLGLSMWRTLLRQLVREHGTGSARNTLVASANNPHTADRAMQESACDEATTPQIIAVVGTTGNPDRLVVLLVVLNTHGEQEHACQSVPLPQAAPSVNVLSTSPSVNASSASPVMAALQAAWVALESSNMRLAHCHQEIDALARLLGTARVRAQTLPLVAGALACRVWPGRFSTHADAVELIDASISARSGKGGKYVHALTKLINQLGGLESVRRAVLESQPSSELGR